MCDSAQQNCKVAFIKTTALSTLSYLQQVHLIVHILEAFEVGCTARPGDKSEKVVVDDVTCETEVILVRALEVGSLSLQEICISKR